MVYNAGTQNVEVYANSGGAVSERYWSPSGGWSSWIGLGGSGIVGTPTPVYNTANGHVEVYANSGGHLVEDWWSASTSWSGWINLGGALS